MSAGEISNIVVDEFIGSTLTISGLPTVGATTVLFEPNDLIQIGNNTYPFTSTTQVLRGTDPTVTITTNRPNILTPDVVSSGIIVGNDCSFKMFCPNMPIYKLYPGGAQYSSSGTLVGNALIEFSDRFQLYEWVATA